MSYSHRYKTLFEVQILHEFFLNNGTEAFDEMNPAKQQERLRNYVYRNFLEVIPTAGTRKVLQNQRMLLRTSNDGFSVVVTTHFPEPDEFVPVIDIADDLELRFLVKVHDPQFENYTDLEIVKKEIFLFANAKPAGIGEMEYIPLKGTGSPLITNAFRMDEGDSADLLKNIPDPEAIGTFGLFVFRMKSDVEMEAGSETPYDITAPGGLVRETPRQFVIEFANRSTIWKYYYTNTPYYAETTGTHPLTRNGFINITVSNLDFKKSDPNAPDPDPANFQDYHYPGPDVRNLEKEDDQYYSAIFI